MRRFKDKAARIIKVVVRLIAARLKRKHREPAIECVPMRCTLSPETVDYIVASVLVRSLPEPPKYGRVGRLAQKIANSRNSHQQTAT